MIFNKMKRPITPTFLFFYIVFLPDTWQLLAGIGTAIWITPRIMPAEANTLTGIMLYFMVAVIGYAATRPIGKWISKGLKKIILGDKAP